MLAFTVQPRLDEKASCLPASTNKPKEGQASSFWDLIYPKSVIRKISFLLKTAMTLG